MYTHEHGKSPGKLSQYQFWSDCNKVIVIGGYKQGKLSSSVYVYYINYLEYEKIRVQETMRRKSHTIQKMDNWLLVVGGQDEFEEMIKEVLIWDIND